MYKYIYFCILSTSITIYWALSFHERNFPSNLNRDISIFSDHLKSFRWMWLKNLLNSWAKTLWYSGGGEIFFSNVIQLTGSCSKIHKFRYNYVTLLSLIYNYLLRKSNKIISGIITNVHSIVCRVRKMVLHH